VRSFRLSQGVLRSEESLRENNNPPAYILRWSTGRHLTPHPPSLILGEYCLQRSTSIQRHLNRSPEAPDRSPQCRRCTRRQAKRSYSIKRPGPLRLRRSTTRTLLLQPRPWHHYASCSPARSKPASQLKISVLAMRPHRHYRTQAFLLGTTRIPLLDAIRSTLTQRLKWPYRLIFRKVSLTPHKLTMMTRGFFIGEVPWRESLRILYPSGSVRNRKRRGCTTREWRDMAAGPIGAVAHLTAILPILKSTFRCTIPPSTPSNGKDASLKGGRS
jgi:hypothetical protein